MIAIDSFTLNNGLRVVVNTDNTTPLVAVNLLYKVGARDEDPEKTGFAHLFEHLMFGGSKNIAVFDRPVQLAGGESNAFTNSDYTNYYILLPRENIETAFWLESDRMMELNFTEESLEVQRQVVIEEFKQRYLNQPYGDAWLHLRPLAYKVHPYRWATIGKDIRHIEKATLEDVKSFFYNHYAPNNAILTVSGNITVTEVRKLAIKWFEEIPERNIVKPAIPSEPAQKEAAYAEVSADVPADALYIAWHMDDRLSPGFYAADLISDILSGGPSSRIHQNLIKGEKIFSQADAFISGSVDPGLFIFNGIVNPGISLEKAEEEVYSVLEPLITGSFHEEELVAMKNKAESAWMFNMMNILNKATNLAFFEMLGDAALINEDLGRYHAIGHADVMEVAGRIFRKSNRSVLYYRKNSTGKN